MSRIAGAPDYFAGVDGGGSTTVAVVVDREGCERGRAASGSSNYTVAGGDEVATQVTKAVTEATRFAGGGLPLRAVWIGLAGVDRPDALACLLPLLRPLSGEIRLTNDAELIFSALDGEAGIVLIAGTGSIALGRDTAGTTARAGGWGHLIGDEGSGYDIGRRALQAAARAADGRGPETVLLHAILRKWELDQPMAIIGHVYQTSDKARIAALSSIVFAAARDGDPVARRIVAAAAGDLALAATAVADRLNFPEGKVPLALAGGLMTREKGYRESVLRQMRRRRILGQVRVVDEPALSAAKSLACSP